MQLKYNKIVKTSLLIFFATYLIVLQHFYTLVQRSPMVNFDRQGQDQT